MFSSSEAIEGQVRLKIMRVARIVRIILCERADAFLLTTSIACSFVYGRVCWFHCLNRALCECDQILRISILSAQTDT